MLIAVDHALPALPALMEYKTRAKLTLTVAVPVLRVYRFPLKLMERLFQLGEV